MESHGRREVLTPSPQDSKYQVKILLWKIDKHSITNCYQKTEKKILLWFSTNGLECHGDGLILVSLRLSSARKSKLIISDFLIPVAALEQVDIFKEI